MNVPAINVTYSNIISSVWLYLPFKQASLVRDLKSWCLSKLQSMEVRFTGDPSSTKLQRSSSMAEGLNEADGAGLTVPPAGHGGSSHCSELHNNPTPLDSSLRDPSVAEGGSANHYLVGHMESSPGKALTNSSPTQICKCKHSHYTPMEILSPKSLHWPNCFL